MASEGHGVVNNNYDLYEEGECRDLPRVKSMATLSSRSSPKRRPTAAKNGANSQEKNRDISSRSSQGNAKKGGGRKMSKSSVDLMSKSLDSESREFRDFEFSEDYLMSLSSGSSDDDYAP